MNHDGFVVILGDLHFPFARDKVEAVVDQILGLSPNKVFILGDLTEMGSDYEFSELSKILQKLSSQGIGIYELLGNHDTRWSSRNRKGVEGFKSFSIRCGPFTFLGLDTSLYFEHYGHIGNRQIQWIESQLKETEGPVVMMAHHPFGGPSNFTDDGWKLMNLIDGSNVRLVLVGHGHSYGVNGRYNGAWFQMVGAAKDGWYTVLSWKGDESFLWALNIDGGCNLIKRIPLSEEKECH
ncbi:MAG: metallophosphoesterase, partial [Pseudothermotoga sp.]|nr:metallophosphoesterase [Pseudothermotoga sp.]